MLETTSVSQGLKIQTPAKVNLTLRVQGVRNDGYHDLESVVAAVTLFDVLTLEPAARVELECRGAPVPPGDENLVMQAARLLAEACGIRDGARVVLEKHIPPGRGFGGGSSDAAATLVGLNALWNAGLSRADLARLGAKIGSDVPLFLASPISVMRGRGERIEPVAAAKGPAWHLVLAWPDYGLSTADVYAAYDRLPARQNRRPRATDILSRLNGPAHEAVKFLVNDLEPAAAVVRAGRMDVRAILERTGATAVCMTGSGSAYFALADTEAEARQVAQAVRAAGAEAAVAVLLGDGAGGRRRPHESDQR